MLILFLILIVLALVILIANIAIVPKRRLSRASPKKSPSRSRSWTLSPSL